MNGLVDQLSPSSLWVVDYLLLASVLLACVLATLAALAQPVRRLAVTKSALVALALAALLSAMPGWSVVHLLTKDRPADVSCPIVAAPARATAPPVEFDEAPQATPETTLPALPRPAAGASPAPTPSWSWADVPWLAIVQIAYALGSACVILWLLVGAVAARSLRARSASASPELIELFRKVAGNPQPLPQLVVSDQTETAIALGIRRPIVVLPQVWTKQFPLPSREGLGEGSSQADHARPLSNPSTDLASVLAHEWAHVKNGDLLWLGVNRALFVLLWVQPFFWLLRRRMRLDQEALADAAAADTTSRPQYAAELVAWARATNGRPRMPAAAAVGLWEGPSQLRQRIAILLDERFTVLRNCSRRWQLSAAITVVTVSTVLSLVTVQPQSLAQTNQKEATNRPELMRFFAEKLTNQERKRLSDLPQADFEAELAKLYDAAKAANSDPKNKIANEQAQPAEINIIVARYVILLEGKKIVTKEDVEQLIAVQADPRKLIVNVYNSSSMTRSDDPDPVGERMSDTFRWSQQLRDRFACDVNYGTSLRTGAWMYDKIHTAADLVPDESTRREGIVQTADGKPLAGAQVCQTEPVDAGRRGNDWLVYLRGPRLNNRLEWRVANSDNSGKFALHSPSGKSYQVFVLHEEGFALVGSEEFAESGKIIVRPWALVRGRILPDERLTKWVEQQPFTVRQRELRQHFLEVDMATGPNLAERGSSLEFQLTGRFVGQPNDNKTYEFDYVPPFAAANVGRSVHTPFGWLLSITSPGDRNGVANHRIAVSDGGATVHDLAPLTDAELESLNRQTEQAAASASRRGGRGAAPEQPAQPATFTPVSPPSQPSTILGRTVDENNKPLAGVELTMYRLNNEGGEHELLARTTSDADGNFSFPPDTFAAKIYPNGAPPHVENRIESVNDPVVVVTARLAGRVSQRLTYRGPEFGRRTGERAFTAMRTAATLKGRITDPEGKPVADAVVTIGPWSPGPVGDALTTRTDANGNYVINDVAPFDLVEYARQQRELAQSRLGGSTAGQVLSNGTIFLVGEPIVQINHPQFAKKMIHAGNIPGAKDVQLDSPALIAGRVVYGDGDRPAAGLVVHIARSYPSQAEALLVPSEERVIRDLQNWTTKTKEDGRYNVQNLPTGDYDVWVEGGEWVHPGIARFSIIPLEGPTCPEIKLTKGGTIRLQFVDAATDQPLATADKLTATLSLIWMDEKNRLSRRYIDSAEAALTADGRMEIHEFAGEFDLAGVAVRQNGQPAWRRSTPGGRQIVSVKDGETIDMRLPMVQVTTTGRGGPARGLRSRGGPATQPAPRGATEDKSANNSNAADSIEITLIVNKHVMLMNRSQGDDRIVTRDEVEKLLKALPNPSLVRLNLKFTASITSGTAAEAATRQQIMNDNIAWGNQLAQELGTRLASFGPIGRGWHYDNIKTAADLLSDESLRKNGLVRGPGGQPLAGAQVMLTPPGDESRGPYTHFISLQGPAVRQRTDYDVTDTDSSGRFKVYPPKDSHYYVLVLHEEGFATMRGDAFERDGAITVQPWAHVRGRLLPDKRLSDWAATQQGPDFGPRGGRTYARPQWIGLEMVTPSVDRWPELRLQMQSVDLRQPTEDGSFDFAYVPPSPEGGLSRFVATSRGASSISPSREGSFPEPYKKFHVEPGKTVEFDLDPLSDEEFERVQANAIEADAARGRGGRRGGG